MAQQGELFPSPAETIKINAARNEPRLWVRRLVIWSKPEEILQDVPLRRGLNIIYSPDPGTAEATLGQKGGSGHGVGKTLFCRFLRYCLGEDTFAHDDLRREIQTRFPEGLVGAEVMINGQLWSVIRPIGTTRKHVSKPDVDLGTLMTDFSEDADITPYYEALNSLISDAVDKHIPGSHDLKRWLFALAWLSRDQEVRFTHIRDWRHPDSDTRSPVRDTSADERNVIIRSFLNIMADEELKAQAERDTLSQRKSRLNQSVTGLKYNTQTLSDEVSEGLGQERPSDAAPLEAATLLKLAQDNLDAADNVPANDTLKTAISGKRDELEKVISEKALVAKKQEEFDGLIAIQEDQIRVLKGEQSNLNADAIKARLGEVCPVCSVPIDEALAEGCGLSHVLPDKEKIEQESSQVQGKISACEQAITRYKQYKVNNETALQNQEKQIDDLRRQIQNLESQADQERKSQRQKWFVAKSIYLQAEKLVKELEQLKSDEAELRDVPDKERQMQETLQRLRAKHSEIMTRLQELFVYVCEGFLGDKDAKLELTGKGIQATVITGGTAMETLKVIAFDLAAMFMSLEGRSFLPSFLIHDSPREGDLGESIYHRLFNFMADMETLGDQPLFQYLVTTTSAPPEKYIEKPYLILELDGREDANRLLKTSL